MKKISAYVLLVLYFTIPSRYVIYGQSQIKFTILPNGTKVDTRISSNIADKIIRRFNAIENGDLMAFRATIENDDIQDGVDIHRYIRFVAFFWGDIIGVDPDTYDEVYNEATNKVFHDVFAPQKRNMWASIEKIKIIEIDYNFGIKVEVLSYEGEIMTYYLGMSMLPDENNFIGGPFQFLEWLSL